MSKVILAVAGVPNTSITMYNNETEDGNIQASYDAGNIDDMGKSQLSVATKRLKSDGEFITDEKNKNKRPTFVSHIDGAVVFPVDKVA